MSTTEKITLTPDLRARIITALGRSWDYISEDAFKNDMGVTDESIVYTRQEVADMAADAGRLTDYGLSPAEMEFYYTLTDAERSPMIHEAFRYARYRY